MSRIHFPVTTLGYGRRVGLWMQGCSIRCPGCISKDTWDVRPSDVVPGEEVLRQLLAWLVDADGLTISGGEPFEQPVALRWLLEGIRNRFEGDVMVYSGYSWEHIMTHAAWIQGVADVVISDPFDPKAGSQRIWRGSDNQRAHTLSSLARVRYGENLESRLWPRSRSLDVCVTEGDVWLAGIPRPGDFSRLRKALLKRDFDASESSESARVVFRA